MAGLPQRSNCEAYRGLSVAATVSSERDAEIVPAAEDPAEQATTEYALFDVLRFFLASSVVLSHVGVFRWDESGALAVQVFFALSGWLIGGILFETEAGALSRFYFNRSTRIWIPYFFCVFALYLTSALHESKPSSRWFEFLACDLTFTHNWFSLLPNADLALRQMPLEATGNHLWSLATEEQFYLAAPLLMTLLPFGRTLVFWVFIAVWAYFFASGYAAISFGVVAAVASKRTPNVHLSIPGTIGLLFAMTGSAVAMFLGATFAYAAPIFAISVVLLVARPTARNAFTRWIGGVSFPLYLNAWIGIFALHAVEKHFHLGVSSYEVPLTFLAAVASAALSYHLIDARVMANRKRYYSNGLGWTLGAVGYCLVLSGCALWFFEWRWYAN